VIVGSDLNGREEKRQKRKKKKKRAEERMLEHSTSLVSMLDLLQ